jgi:hypothetical protein
MNWLAAMARRLDDMMAAGPVQTKGSARGEGKAAEAASTNYLRVNQP